MKTPGTVPSRRQFLSLAAGAAAGAVTGRLRAGTQAPAAGPVSPGPGPRRGGPTAFIHTTDLFRPHFDPDDHWDLATSYALASRGDLEILGILADNPRNLELLPELSKDMDAYVDAGVHHARSPDVAAVAQMNYLTDRAVPVATGTIWPGTPGERVRADHLPPELRGVHLLLDLLRTSPRPVAILIGGSCQDVAVAGMKEPRLFSEKCAGIYLTAGVGSPDPKDQRFDLGVEWNVNLNPGAYAAIFELPCPIYWMPCHNNLHAVGVGGFGTYWTFRYGEVVPQLAARMQAYVACVLSRESGTDWLSYLLDPKSPSAVQKFLGETKAMWSTAGFVHAAGRVVTVDGDLVSQGASGGRDAYEFLPIQVRCDSDGITSWEPARTPTNRYIFRVTDRDRYACAMLRAFKTLLLELS